MKAGQGRISTPVESAALSVPTPAARGVGRSTPAGAYAWYVVAVLLLVNALSYLDRQALSFLIVPMEHDLKISDTEAGLLLGPAFVVFYAVAGLFLGALADRASRRNLLIGGVAIWSLATVSFGLVTGFPALLALRAVIGLGEACVVPAAFSLVADYFPSHRRGLASSVVTVGISFGVGAALFGGGLMLRAMEAFRGTSWPLLGPREPWQLAYLAFGGLGMLVIGLLLTVREPLRGGMDATTSPSETTFIPFLTRNRVAVFLMLAAYFMLAFSLYALSSWLPALLMRRHAMDAATAATTYGLAVLLCSPLGAISGGVAGDWLAARFAAGRFLLMVVLAPVMLPGLLLIALPQSMTLVFGGICLTMLVAGTLSMSAFQAVQDTVPIALRGRMLGLHGLLSNCIGIGLGPPAVAFVTERILHSPDKLHLSIVATGTPAICIMTLCAWFGVRRYAALRRTYSG